MIYNLYIYTFNKSVSVQNDFIFLSQFLLKLKEKGIIPGIIILCPLVQQYIWSRSLKIHMSFYIWNI